MALYLIKGVDGKEYGPVDASTVTAWINERRIAPFSEIKPEGAVFARADSFEEFKSSFSNQPTIAPVKPKGQASLDPAARLDPGLALSVSWERFKAEWSLAFTGLALWLGIFFVLGMAFEVLEFALQKFGLSAIQAVCISQGLNILTSLFIGGALSVGLYKFLLNIIDDTDPKVEDLLEGFQVYWASTGVQWIKFLAGLFIGIVFGGGFFLLHRSLVEKIMNTAVVPMPEGWIILGIWSFAFATAIILFYTLLFFAELLIADRVEKSVLGSCATSVRLALAHLIPIAWLFTIISCIMIAGLILCILPFFLTLPWMLLAMAHGYRQLVPRTQTSPGAPDLTPPTTDA